MLASRIEEIEAALSEQDPEPLCLVLRQLGRRGLLDPGMLFGVLETTNTFESYDRRGERWAIVKEASHAAEEDR